MPPSLFAVVRILYRFLASLAWLAVRSGRSKDLKFIELRHQLSVLLRREDPPAVTNDDRTVPGAKLRELVVRLAAEKSKWRHRRIQGGLARLGYQTSKTTVWQILTHNGINLSPNRSEAPGATAWTTQAARNLFIAHGEHLDGALVRDRGNQFIDSFDEIFRAEGMKILKTSMRTPVASTFTDPSCLLPRSLWIHSSYDGAPRRT